MQTYPLGLGFLRSWEMTEPAVPEKGEEWGPEDQEETGPHDTLFH